MKKHLFIFGGIITLGAIECPAYVMTTAKFGNIPSHVILDKRPVVRALQEAMRNSAGGVQAALVYAEANSSDYSDLDVEEGSYAGLNDSNQVSVINGVITFNFALSEVMPGATITWSLSYTPRWDGSQSIDGWTCTSTAGSSNLGSNYISVSSGLDPVTSGLGWPYAGCAVQTPS